MDQNGFVHFCYPSGSSSWVLRLLNRLHQSPSCTLRQRISESWESKLGELALAVSSKIHLVGVAVKRIDAVIHRIATEVQQRETEVLSLINNDACLHIRGDGLLFEALLDIESFLFEMRSTLEITETFVKKFRQNILGDASGCHQDLEDCLSQLGIDQSWYVRLKCARDFFSHQTAPWLAVAVKTDPRHFDLVVLTTSDKIVLAPGDYFCFEKPKDRKRSRGDYFYFEEFRKMYCGYLASMEQLQTWLMTQIDSYK